MARARRESGFSLVELLVVICIIMILAGLLLAALRSAWIAYERSRTQSLLDSLATGIGKYQETNSRLPLADSANAVTLTFASGGQSITNTYRFPGTNLHTALCTTAEGGPYCEVSADFVKDGYLVDIWGRPITYIPAEHYAAYRRSGAVDPAPPAPSVNPGGAVYASPGQYHNFTSYQLRSLGKDGKDNDGSGDDLQNFAK